jgi:transposase
MSDAEWAFLGAYVIESGPRRGRRPRDHRLVLDGIFWIARTGAQWRDLPEYFGKWSSVYRQFRRWTTSGLWDLLLEGLSGSGMGQPAVQMIDSTIIRAHHCAAGAKGGLKKRLLAVREVALRRKFTCEPME